MVLLNSGLVELGTKIKNFNLPDTVSGKNISNADLSKDLVVIAFICNHCPYVVRIIKDFSKLALEMKDRVDFIAISANDPDYNEEASPENMAKFAKEHNFSFPYLFDESQSVAKDFDAVCTPDIFVYKHGALAYHARFEDLEKALKDLKEKDSINFEDKVSAGCSIKWK